MADARRAYPVRIRLHLEPDVTACQTGGQNVRTLGLLPCQTCGDGVVLARLHTLACDWHGCCLGKGRRPQRRSPATASAEGAQFNVPPFPATASAEGAQLNGRPSPGAPHSHPRVNNEESTDGRSIWYAHGGSRALD